jgi:hypothetical protein
MACCCFGLAKPNATRQARLKAGAQRTLEAVACTRLFGQAPRGVTEGMLLALVCSSAPGAGTAHVGQQPSPMLTAWLCSLLHRL